MTNGLKSSEFWTMILVLVIGLVLVLTDKLGVDSYWPFAAGVGGIYVAGRSYVKSRSEG